MPYDEFEEEDFTTQYGGKTLQRLAEHIRPYWKRLVLLVLSVALAATIDSYFTYLGKRVVDEGILAANRPVLRQLILTYGALTLVQAAGLLGVIRLTGLLGQRIQYDLRKKMFNHLQMLSFSYFDRTPVGWIMARVTSDSERIADLVAWGLLDLSFSALSVASSLYFMIRLNWQLGLVVFTAVPILVLVAVPFRRKIIVEYRKVRKVNSKITGAYNENISGVRVVKALCREEENLREFSGLTHDMYRAGFRAAWLSALFLPTVQLVASFVTGGVIWYSGWQAEVAGISIGTIQAFVSYVTFMLWPVQDMARIFAEMQHTIASAERVFALIDAAPDVVDQPGALEVPSILGDIEFEHVDFYYEPHKPVLSDFNLQVRQGETIALVGPTGGGKSTIINLLSRFYEPKRGIIRIAGHDYTTLSLQTIQSRLGVVLQTPHLFSGTVRENIRYGRLEATDAEVEEAAQQARAHNFIVTLEKGYDTQVGEGGGLLSVGQKQLISLARAILAQPEIFIMDEATSSVDTLTEALIQQGMQALMEGRTSFIIAHRLSTIRRADRILVIEEGRITEMGTHAELLRARGHYYRLYTKQFELELEQECNVLDARLPAVA